MCSTSFGFRVIISISKLLGNYNSDEQVALIDSIISISKLLGNYNVVFI